MDFPNSPSSRFSKDIPPTLWALGRNFQQDFCHLFTKTGASEPRQFIQGHFFVTWHNFFSQTNLYFQRILWGYFSGAAARQQNSPELADCTLILSINSPLSIPRTLVLGCFHCVPPCHVIWRLSRAIHSIIPYISDFPPRSTTRSIAVSDETCRRLYPVRYTMRRAFLESSAPAVRSHGEPDERFPGRLRPSI